MAVGGGVRESTRGRGTSYIEQGFFCKIWKDEVSLDYQAKGVPRWREGRNQG